MLLNICRAGWLAGYLAQCSVTGTREERSTLAALMNSSLQLRGGFCLSLVGVALVFDAVSDPVNYGKCLLESPGPGLGLGRWMMYA